MVLFCRLAQMVENASRLDARNTPLGIDFDDCIHEPREVEDDGDIHRLAGDCRASAARKHRNLVAAADVHRFDDVRNVARDDDPDRDLPVV